MAKKTNVVPFKKKVLTNPGALKHLYDINGGDAVTVGSYAQLAAILGWEKTRTFQAVKRWVKNGRATIELGTNGELVAIKAFPPRKGIRGKGTGAKAPAKTKRTRKKATVIAPPVTTGPVNADAPISASAAVNVDTDKAVNGSRAKPVNADGAQNDGGGVNVVPRKPVISNTYVNSVAEEIPPKKPPPEVTPERPDTSVETVTERPPGVPERPSQTVTPKAPESAPPATKGSRLMNLFRTRRASAKDARPSVPVTVESKPPQKIEDHREPAPEVIHAHIAADGDKSLRSIARGVGWKYALLGAILGLLAAALSIWTAYLAVGGLLVLFAGLGQTIVIGGWIIESIKFFGSAYIVGMWRYKPLLWCIIAGFLILVAELLNCAAIYNNLIAAYLGESGSRAATYTTKDADAGAKIEVATARVQEIDRRLHEMDATVEGAARRGSSRAERTRRDQRTERAKLDAEKEAAVKEMADLKAARTGLTARHEETEAAAMPIRHTAELLQDVGIMRPSTPAERVIMWVSFLVVLCCDPLALACAILVASWLPVPRLRKKKA